MSGKGMKWESVALRRKAANGQLVGVEHEEQNPLADLFKGDGDRSARLRLFLEFGPSGERDVSKILDTPERASRDGWLRGVLDSCED
jgi:hypothetical protein